jgi:hypothetical protein
MEILGHLVLAVVLQLLVVRLCGSWPAGALVASAWAISREITQAEYRWIEIYGGGLRSNMPWWGRFDLRIWSRLDPWLDWLLPSVLVAGIALVILKRHSAKSILR